MEILFINSLMNQKSTYSRVLMNELRRKNLNNRIFFLEVNDE